MKNLPAKFQEKGVLNTWKQMGSRLYVFFFSFPWLFLFWPTLPAAFRFFVVGFLSKVRSCQCVAAVVMILMEVCFFGSDSKMGRRSNPTFFIYVRVKVFLKLPLLSRSL